MVQTVEAVAEEPATTPRPTTAQRLAARVPLIVGVVAAASVALWSRAKLFPLYSGDSDESAYIYQARMLVQGHVTLPTYLHRDFFFPWLFGSRGDRVFSQYQPGWPAVIAIAHVLGSEQIALVIVAVVLALAVYFLAQEIEPGAGIFALGIMLFSPFFIIHSGLYLSYLWEAALVAGATAAALAGLRTRRRAPFILCGALFGIAQLVRPVDAFVVAVLVFAYLGVTLYTREHDDWLRIVAALAIGLVPFLFITTLYNNHITGHPLKFPITAVEPLDKFGFGPRKLAPETATLDYTRARAVKALSDNLGAFPRWIAGGGIGVVFSLAGVVIYRKKSQAWLLLAIACVFPIVYFFWWGTSLSAVGSRNGLGPHYHIPSLPPLAALAGVALYRLAKHTRVLTSIACVAIVIGTLTVMHGIVDNAHYTTGVSRGKEEALADAKHLKNAIVVMRADPRLQINLDYQFLVGDPELKDRVLYANDLGPRVAELADDFPDRRLYQWVQRDEPSDQLMAPSNLIEPLVIKRGPIVELDFTLTNTEPRPFVIGYVKLNSAPYAQQTLASKSDVGQTSHLRVLLVAPGTTPPPISPGTLVVPIPGDGTIDVGAAFSSDGSLTNADVYERKFYVALDPKRPGQLAVQTPGLHFHLYTTNGTVWVRQNVGPHLVETG